jgi:hypothetical protein
MGGGANGTTGLGGGGGGFAMAIIDVSPGSVLPTITVGAANGGASSVGSLVAATGGSGSTGGTGSTAAGLRGARTASGGAELLQRPAAVAAVVRSTATAGLVAAWPAVAAVAWAAMAAMLLKAAAAACGCRQRWQQRVGWWRRRHGRARGKTNRRHRHGRRRIVCCRRLRAAQ